MILHPPPDDPSRVIAEELDSAFLFEIGAKAPHRVGLMRGLGFMLMDRRPDTTNHIRVTAGREGYCVTFLDTTLPEERLDAPESRIVRAVTGVPLDKLRETIDVPRA